MGLFDTEEMSEVTVPPPFKLIDRYQREDPIRTEKLICAEYKRGYVRGGCNTIKRITYKDKIVIAKKLQRYVVRWYHMYLFFHGFDRTEENFLQHLYWPYIRNVVRKEVTYCDVCQRTKHSTK